MWTVSCLMPVKEKMILYLFSEAFYFSLSSSGWNALQEIMPNKQFAIRQQ